jgi:phosphotriesterase-related protein
MLPHLRAVRDRGFRGFVDCTPAYLGRDVTVLRRLAEATDMHILTNTGYYGAAGDKYVPKHAYTDTVDQLAARWVREWQAGIDGTDIKPGFIKVGVDGGPLSDIDRKLVEAAAKAHLQTGLTIACHTGEARAALGAVETVRRGGLDPSALIVVHTDSIGDPKVHLQIAAMGAWVEYDHVSERSVDKHVELIRMMIQKGYADRLLLSHDAGWYRVGEPNGSPEKVRPFTALPDRLLPALKRAGVAEAIIEKILVANPARAFAVGVRKP